MDNLRKAAQQMMNVLDSLHADLRWELDAPSLNLLRPAEDALKAALEQPEHPRRLTDDQIGQIWFAAKIPGLTESDARRLIRAAEEAR